MTWSKTFLCLYIFITTLFSMIIKQFSLWEMLAGPHNAGDFRFLWLLRINPLPHKYEPAMQQELANFKPSALSLLMIACRLDTLNSVYLCLREWNLTAWAQRDIWQHTHSHTQVLTDPVTRKAAETKRKGPGDSEFQSVDFMWCKITLTACQTVLY